MRARRRYRGPNLLTFPSPLVPPQENTVIVPEDQLKLTQKEMDEEITRCVRARPGRGLRWRARAATRFHF
jgi:hypothetical protein